jgi:hypothetical protein
MRRCGVGFDVYYQRFDTERYESVRLAALDFLERRDPGPIRAELAAAHNRLPPEEALARLDFGPFLYREEKLGRLTQRLERAAPLEDPAPDDVDRLVREMVVPTRVESCVGWRSRVDPSQMMSAVPLPELLSSQSKWLEDKTVMSAPASDA